MLLTQTEYLSVLRLWHAQRATVLAVLLLRQLPWQNLSRAHRPVPSGQLRQLQQRLKVPLWEQSLRNIASMLPTKHLALLVSLQV